MIIYLLKTFVIDPDNLMLACELTVRCIVILTLGKNIAIVEFLKEEIIIRSLESYNNKNVFLFFGLSILN